MHTMYQEYYRREYREAFWSMLCLRHDYGHQVADPGLPFMHISRRDRVFPYPL